MLIASGSGLILAAMSHSYSKRSIGRAFLSWVFGVVCMRLATKRRVFTNNRDSTWVASSNARCTPGAAALASNFYVPLLRLKARSGEGLRALMKGGRAWSAVWSANVSVNSTWRPPVRVMEKVGGACFFHVGPAAMGARNLVPLH